MSPNTHNKLPLLAAAGVRAPLQGIHGSVQTYSEPAQLDPILRPGPANPIISTTNMRNASQDQRQPPNPQLSLSEGHSHRTSPAPRLAAGVTKRKKAGKAPKYGNAEWDSNKEKIRFLYIVTNQPLNTVMKQMAQAHGFDASQAMYKKKLKEWKMFKNESSRQMESRTDESIERLGDRSRPMMALPEIPEECHSELAFAWRARGLRWPCPELKALECMIASADKHIKCLFSQGRAGDRISGWKGDSFGLIPPEGYKDSSKEWKMIADQCHGASSLIRQKEGSQEKCQRTLFKVFQGIDRLAQQDDPWMLVYLWRIILYMRGISYRIEHHKVGIPSASLGPHNDHLVGHVISSLAGLILIRKGLNCEMVECLNSLRVFPLDIMKLAIERVFKCCIDSFQKYLGESHPVVLFMVARFLRYWPGELADHVLPNFEVLVARSEKEFGPSDERTISFLTEYMYVAHYHAHDSSLTCRLALVLCQRCEKMEPVPQWGKRTHGLVLASKLLSRMDKENGNIGRWEARLHPLATKLRNGDRESQTRALQIRRMMAQWYQEAGNEAQAQKERDAADEIFKCMRELFVQQGDWNLSWSFPSAQGCASELAHKILEKVSSVGHGPCKC